MLVALSLLALSRVALSGLVLSRQAATYFFVRANKHIDLLSRQAAIDSFASDNLPQKNA